MLFEKLDNNVFSAKESSLATSYTAIETKVVLIWKNDGYDDKVPVAQAEAY